MFKKMSKFVSVVLLFFMVQNSINARKYSLRFFENTGSSNTVLRNRQNNDGNPNSELLDYCILFYRGLDAEKQDLMFPYLHYIRSKENYVTNWCSRKGNIGHAIKVIWTVKLFSSIAHIIDKETFWSEEDTNAALSLISPNNVVLRLYFQGYSMEGILRCLRIPERQISKILYSL